MKQIVELTELKPRAEAIRWTLGDVSLAAGVARTTAYQVVEHLNPKRSTHEALSSALIAEELRLRDHLIGLHGLPAAPCETPSNDPVSHEQ